MADVVYTEATPQDVALLERYMRKQDRDELTAASGSDVLDTLYRSLDISTEAITARDPELGLLCVFGLCPFSLSSTRAAPWLVGTDALTKRNHVLARDGRRYIRHAMTVYTSLVNYVDARNRWSIAWLRRIGFTLDAPAPFGVQGRMFHRFHMEAQSDV